MKAQVKVTYEMWCMATFLGFRSNGCTCSPDTLYGMPIAHGTNQWPPLPCDLHDFRYWMGGDDEDRLLADIELRAALDATADYLFWPLRWFGHKRADAYYITVRAKGESHFDRAKFGMA